MAKTKLSLQARASNDNELSKRIAAQAAKRELCAQEERSSKEQLSETKRQVELLAQELADSKRLIELGASSTQLSLPNDRKVKFELLSIAASEIENKTTVSALNGRDQRFLTQESVQDIIDSLAIAGQFYPAIGNKLSDGRIDILSGSRRRQACIFTQKEFKVLVASETISREEAQFIAQNTNAQKPLSIVELALAWQEALNNGQFIDQKSLAKAVGRSAASVTRILNAAKIPSAWLLEVPDLYSLTHTQVTALVKAATKLDEAKILAVSEELKKVRLEQKHCTEVLSNEELVAQIVNCVSNASKTLNPAEKKSNVEHHQLFKAGNRSVKAKVERSANRMYQLNLQGKVLTQRQVELLMNKLAEAISEFEQ
ncbi:MAG: ParB/RepB/Spo0J family partition protein [Vibrionaceae bacterium]